MALSEKFFERAQKAAACSPAKPTIWEDALDAATKPVFDLFEKLRHLPRDKDGNGFSYTFSRSPVRKVVSLGVKAGFGAHTNTGVQSTGPGFYLMIRQNEDDAGYSFSISEPDARAGPEKVRETYRTESAQNLVDEFLANWVGRVMPGAVAQLAAQEKPPTALQKVNAGVGRFLDKFRHR